MSIDLAKPIAAYFEADRETGETVSECFTPDAVVRDEGHTYRGTSEIRQWRAAVAAKYTYTCEPLAAAQEGDSTVVTCHLVGNFPGSPVDLRFFFRVDGNKISSLEVIP